MQNGKQILEIIQQLQSIDKGWEGYILNEETEMPENMRKELRRLMYEMRIAMKSEPEEVMRGSLLAEHVSEEVAESLIKKTQNALQFYFAFDAIRRIEKRDKKALEGLLASIYQKYIVRLERGYLERIDLEGGSREEIYDIANRMRYLTEYYVSKRYTRKGMIQDLLDETGLEEESCEYWANLIEQNYMELKLNYIVGELERIRKYHS